ncbi:MAG: alpha/beta hydrolase [Porticoccaceae bacterium]|jgi:pimeloyl-ACP methyl ester carboxylesterase|nr:alpha/beta hydrolase [Porticoccaceae bacterium]MEA3299075.1 alpha/beta hydrolase [Pseudomonadota bacterium]HLS97893.1 alpha/beta hydrolase [Porticoccaceae bacterium]
MTPYAPLWYQSRDGLDLFARHYPGDGPFPLLCMHGLTRNSADFEDLVEHLAGRYPILAVDQRGRGESAWDPEPARYQVPVYAEDMFTLLERQGITGAVLIGTSMGGLIAMQMLAMRPDLVKGLVLNDIGAVIEAAGLARIQDYMGKAPVPVTSWGEAARQTRAVNGLAFPDYGDDDWLRFARRLYRENSEGQPVIAFDPAIAPAPTPGAVRAVDMWAFYDSLPDVPLLIIRGALSDLLSGDCVAEMVRRKTRARAVEIPNRGHAPALDEPEAVAAIEAFLGELRQGDDAPGG